MHDLTLLVSLGFDKDWHLSGGQELILPEIVASLNGCSLCWSPFLNPSFEDYLFRMAIQCTKKYHEACDCLYFGTPTIVDDKPFFPKIIKEPEKWTYKFERRYVRNLCKAFSLSKNAKVIVSGLGTGDVSVKNRISDMGPGAKAVAMKDFDTFKDWLIVRRLK